ncbi:unnamed protein product [Prorocentrum cordatum]|uniref:Uncharacterized protein n=1 Tax=Prorocentrum cordatum TaxID=2364126 RepID=A0ABN9YJ69_9DINO|nr:unnamed protein product [Polarella glacialis]
MKELERLEAAGTGGGTARQALSGSAGAPAMGAAGCRVDPCGGCPEQEEKERGDCPDPGASRPPGLDRAPSKDLAFDGLRLPRAAAAGRRPHEGAQAYGGDHLASSPQSELEGEAQASANYFQREAGDPGGPLQGSATRTFRRHAFPTGAVYEGQWLGERRDGHGKQHWPDGASYEGEWRSGGAEGRGAFEHCNGDAYIGEWQTSAAHGLGVYRHHDGSVYTGEFRADLQDGHGVQVWPERSRFEGQFRGGKKHGHGTYVWPDLSRYEGSWVRNRMQGPGRYTGSDGRRYSGIWHESAMHGCGQSTWPDGRRYQGQYAKDQAVRAADPLLVGPTLLICSSRCPEVPACPPCPECPQCPQMAPTGARQDMRWVFVWLTKAEALWHQRYVVGTVGSSEIDFFVTSPNDGTCEESCAETKSDIIIHEFLVKTQRGLDESARANEGRPVFEDVGPPTHGGSCRASSDLLGWRFESTSAAAAPRPAVRRELRRVAAPPPLLRLDLSAKWATQATAADASPRGRGVSAATVDANASSSRGAQRRAPTLGHTPPWQDIASRLKTAVPGLWQQLRDSKNHQGEISFLADAMSVALMS